MLSKTPISVLVICQNAERTLARTLDSLVDFSEIVIIDGGSVDKTEQIARRYPNVAYYYNPWRGFIAQRNYSIEKASHHWCFMMDADEVCTPELRDEIFRVVAQDNPAPMYRIVRTEYFLGEAIEIGLGKSDYQERLFIRDRIRYTGGNHHQHLLDGKLITADTSEVVNFDRKFRILHDDSYSMADWVKKLPRFVLLVAHEKIDKGRRVSALEAFFSFFAEFIKVYLKSWRGGRVSFINCLLHAIYSALVKIYIYQYHQFPEFNRKKLIDKGDQLG
jgi:glycosyltransferase involved in cell wall biosynthesis